MDPEEKTVENNSRQYIVLLSLFWNNKYFILKTVISTLILSVVLFLVLPKYYRSSVVLLPQDNNGSMFSGGGISGLASLAGVSLGQSSDEKLFPAVIQSETLLHEVLFKKYTFQGYDQGISLVEFWDIKEDSANEIFELGLKKIRKEIEIAQDNETGSITISILTKNPALSSLVVNEIALQLDNVIREKKKSYASEQKKWIEARMIQVALDLKLSEESLKDFRMRNRDIMGSPELILQMQRLSREVEMNTVIFSELKKQFEITKIEEIKNLPIINVLDWGRPAAKKEKPQGLVIVLIGFLFSFVLSCGYVLYRFYFLTKTKDIIAEINRNSKTQVI